MLFTQGSRMKLSIATIKTAAATAWRLLPQKAEVLLHAANYARIRFVPFSLAKYFTCLLVFAFKSIAALHSKTFLS